jgi:hypothetical protein
MRGLLIAASVGLLTLSGPAEAQWLNYPDPRVPRTADGKPILTAPPPRAADGKPDLSGVWHVQSEPLAIVVERLGRSGGPPPSPVGTAVGMEINTVSMYAIDVTLDYKPGEIVMAPEAAALYEPRLNGKEFLPTTYCQPGGIPLSTLLSEAFKIVQTPSLTLIIHELDGFPRQIYSDGRALPTKIEFPSWLGYSVGRWEADTFVVDTIGFNDRSWLDGRGHPHSEELRITERYRRRDVGHLDVETTIDDRKYYSKPFSFKVTHLLQVDSDIVEYICNEAEKDLAHMTSPK